MPKASVLANNKRLLFAKENKKGTCFRKCLNLLRADDGTRTRDLLTTNEVRYHLCHISLIWSTDDIIHEPPRFVKPFFKNYKTGAICVSNKDFA